MKLFTVIIEDDHEMGTFLQTVLADHGIQAQHASTGIAGFELIEHTNPNLVLLDLLLPDIQGSSLCEKIKKQFPETIVIMITAQDSPGNIVEGLTIGADDYLSKPIDPDELIARIKARFRNTESFLSSKLNYAHIELDQNKHQVLADSAEINLSAQEFKLLSYFLANPEKVLSRDMILARIWGNSPEIETRVVDVYIGYLRKKIPGGRNLLHSIRGFGYILKEK
ncbi:MAG: response regulator transcription factor [Patescibacteria group bacterium]